ncbi:MAG: hypothetical protein C5B59_10800 [Bacteroidetes bacterium]|nr:MAG: hypothetical protein C5B59_10800 [Bacteroidota bacterium]
MARIVFLGIVIYLLYRLVFDLIIPIYKTTRHVKRQFNNMRDSMNQSNGQSSANTPRDNNVNSNGQSSKVGEYIEFEEMKK